MKFRHLHASFLLLAAAPAMAGEPPSAADAGFCQQVPAFAGLKAKFEGYAAPADVDRPPMFDAPFHLAAGDEVTFMAKRGAVCIAVAVDETGKAIDAAAYSPAHLRLSRAERRTLLSASFAPALKDGAPVKGLFLLPLRAP